jgi:hypothetical protein
MNWSNPKRIAAVFLFFLAAGLLLLTVISAFYGSVSPICTPEEKAQGVAKCSSNPIVGFLAGGIMGGMCCLPVAFVLFVAGAFLWSGAKKDDLRDMEINAYKRGEKVSKKTEGI